MSALGFSWVLGQAFWDELVLLQRTADSPVELARVRRERLLAALRAAGVENADRDPHLALAGLAPARRHGLGARSLWRRRTSGSSGHAVEVSVARPTYAQMLAGFWRGMGWWGVTPGEPGMALLGAGGSRLRRRLIQVKDRALGIHRILVGDGLPWVREAASLLGVRRYAYLYGYPSALLELAAGGARPCSPPKVVVTTGEPLFVFQRQVLERTFRAPVAEEFGCSELGTVAFECPRGFLHLTEEQVWLEAVDRRTLATSLLPRPVPVLRYPLDEPVTEVRRPCACGLATARAVLSRRQTHAWQRFEEATRRVTAQAGLPARFTVCCQEGEVLEVPIDAPQDQAEVLSAALGPEAKVVRVKQLPRRAAGKFVYFEGPE